MNFQRVLPHLLALLIILGVNVFYFFPQFQGKVIPQGDIIQYQGMAHEATTYQKETGEKALWTNAMFGGMPTFQINSIVEGNYLQHVEKAFNFYMPRPAGYFIMGMLSFYLMMLLLGVNPWLALIGSLFFGFSTNNLILYEAGHTSKLRTIMISPLIISGMLLVFNRKYLIGAAAFMLGMGINILANHVQMTYYLGLSLLILVVIFIVNQVRKKDFGHLSKSLGILGICTLIALGASTANLWSTYVYSQSTMRGGAILSGSSDQAKGGTSQATKTGGLEWDYAMQWSNGFGDLLSSFIPKAVGGGSGEKLSGNSNLAKAVGQRSGLQAPLYFGALPFTSGPIYFGALVFFLFVFGAFVYKGVAKWWLVIAVGLLLLLSMGHNASFITRLFFDYFPMYNKFRTPNSILSIAAILVPILGILGLSTLIKEEDKTKYLKPLYYSGGALIGISLLVAFFGSSFFDYSSGQDAQLGEFVKDLQEDRMGFQRSSALRTVFFILFGMGLIYAYIREKIGVGTMIGLLGFLGFADLVMVDTNYLSASDFESKRAYNQNFEPRLVDQQILQDKDPNFRVLDVSVNTFNSASTSYFHKTIGGYHAAKLQRYQDIIDRHISNNNMAVLNMLNTKYIIVPGEDKNVVSQRNPAALGNAWFVENVKMVDSPDAEIDSLKSFDPSNTAFVHKEFSSYMGNATHWDRNGKIALKSYTPNKVVYNTESGAEQFAVFSEIWYGPDKGWTATIDGKSTDFIRANYILRAMKVPAGNHEIVFEFKPASYYTGIQMNRLFSLLILGICLFTIVRYKPWNNVA